MLRIPFSQKDTASKRAFDFVEKNAMGVPILATQEPTTATLKTGQPVIYNGWIYLKSPDGTGYKFQLTAL
jgi:hypothetical protein